MVTLVPCNNVVSTVELHTSYLPSSITRIDFFDSLGNLNRISPSSHEYLLFNILHYSSIEKITDITKN